MVDAFLTELAIDAAEDPSPPTAEGQLAIDDLRSRYERLKTMSPEDRDESRGAPRRCSSSAVECIDREIASTSGA